MKNLIVSLSLVLATGLTPVFASGTDTDPRAEKAFARQFAGAQNVEWTKLENEIQKVSFLYAGSRAEAYFSSNGEFLGSARNIFFNQLPLVVMQAVSNRFAEPIIIEIKEITNEEGTSYKILLEQKEKKYSLKLSSTGGINELVKLKK